MFASLYRQTLTRRLFSIIAILLSHISFVSTTSPVICYNAFGSPDDSYVACDPTGVTTHACCLPDDICFQNGLCVGSLGAGVTPYYTSKCTNPTYNATGCFKNCNNGILHTRDPRREFPADQLQWMEMAYRSATAHRVGNTAATALEDVIVITPQKFLAWVLRCR